MQLLFLLVARMTQAGHAFALFSGFPFVSCSGAAACASTNPVSDRFHLISFDYRCTRGVYRERRLDDVCRVVIVSAANPKQGMTGKGKEISVRSSHWHRKHVMSKTRRPPHDRP